MKRLVTAIARVRRESAERRKVRQAESRIRELIDCLNQAREAVIVTDLDRRITFWNGGAERLSGWTAGEALEKISDELFEPATAARIAAACKAALDQGEWAGELEIC